MQGQTQNTWVSVSFNAPITAGSVWQELEIGSPPGYICIGECYTFTQSLEYDTILVGFFNLNQLPSSGTDYFVARNPDNAHPDSAATWGTTFTINQLLNVASIYHQLTGYLLSTNDMSLPEGGLFDVFADTTYVDWQGDTVSGTWYIPHRDHRTGHAFDVNRADSSGIAINFLDNLNLKNAIYEANRQLTGQGSVTFPIERVCEPGGRIHINAYDP